MRSNFLQTWASWIILIPEKNLRENSKHQKEIIKLQNLIRKIAETGSIEKANELIQIQPIKCRGETKYVSHCRYLQYLVDWLKNQDYIHLNEGKEK